MMQLSYWRTVMSRSTIKGSTGARPGISARSWANMILGVTSRSSSDTSTFKVFRQSGNQGGGAAIERTVSEGKGNGNGVPEPGEKVTIWVKMTQGMDPFDKNTW